MQPNTKLYSTVYCLHMPANNFLREYCMMDVVHIRFFLLFLQISEILSRFERKGFKLVAIKLVVPSKEFAQKHYHDLKDRPFFNGLCDFLSSGPVLAMVN